ncbi:MAG: flagellar biosynthesis protein FliQ [Burkholderiales bacterium]|jgi:flagellar biosynthetic protein FliQ|nr:flagellar biosynthesis protein FliQ [Nitrosomonadaceae bacterium]
MSPQEVIGIGTEGLEIMLLLAAPLLLVVLVVGFAISVLQAATQINEQTLSFVPKLIAVAITMVIAGPWMINLMVTYIQRLLGRIPFVIG